MTPNAFVNHPNEPTEADLAAALGGAKVLPRVEVDKLFDSRTRYGVKARTGPVPGCPVVAEDLNGSSEKIEVTREELIALIDEALRARGVTVP